MVRGGCGRGEGVAGIKGCGERRRVWKGGGCSRDKGVWLHVHVHMHPCT